MNPRVLDTNVPSLGLTLLGFSAGLTTGAIAGQRLTSVSVVDAWVVAAVVLALLYLYTSFAAARPTVSRLIGLAGLLGFSSLYLVVAAGQSYPRVMRTFSLSGIMALVGVLAVFCVSVAVPFAICLAGAIRVLAAGRPSAHAAVPGPVLVRALSSVVTTSVLIIMGLSAAVMLPTTVLKAVGVLLCALSAPVIGIPIWSSTYIAVLRRREVAAPERLRYALDALRKKTDFVFNRVLCLDPHFARAPICEVVPSFSGKTLVISAALIDRLPDDKALLAVVAHEAAHVIRHHIARAIATLATAGVVVLLSVSLVVYVFEAATARRVGVLVLIPASLGLAVARGLYQAFVTRRHEAEADAFAVKVVGSEAMITALTSLREDTQLRYPVHNRWTTHGTWEARISRIRGT